MSFSEENPCEYCDQVMELEDALGQAEDELQKMRLLAVSTSEEGTGFYYKDAYEACVKQTAKWGKALRDILKICEQMRYCASSKDVCELVENTANEALED